MNIISFLDKNRFRFLHCFKDGDWTGDLHHFTINIREWIEDPSHVLGRRPVMENICDYCGYKIKSDSFSHNIDVLNELNIIEDEYEYLHEDN